MPAAVLIGACSAEAVPPVPTVPIQQQTPESLDGLWLLEGSELNLDIDAATAAVDGRTRCARVLGSLTFEDGGRTTSFSLPGKDDSGCSATGRDVVAGIVEMLESVQRATPEPGGFRLFDGDGQLLGRLRNGG